MKKYYYCFLVAAIILFGIAILQIEQRDYASAVVSFLYCFIVRGCYETTKLKDKLKKEKEKMNQIYDAAKAAEEEGLSLIINTKGENAIVLSAGKEVTEDEKGGEK